MGFLNLEAWSSKFFMCTISSHYVETLIWMIKGSPLSQGGQDWRGPVTCHFRTSPFNGWETRGNLHKSSFWHMCRSDVWRVLQQGKVTKYPGSTRQCHQDRTLGCEIRGEFNSQSSELFGRVGLRLRDPSSWQFNVPWNLRPLSLAVSVQEGRCCLGFLRDSF